MGAGFDPLALLDVPVLVKESRLDLVFGCASVDERGVVKIEVRENLAPHEKLSVLVHEVAHVLCDSFAAGEAMQRFERRAIREAGGLLDAFGRKAYLVSAGLVKSLTRWLEDARVEYQLVRSHPGALPYIAAVRDLQMRHLEHVEWGPLLPFESYMKAAASAVFRIVRFGWCPPGWEWLYRSLVPRLVLHVRGRHGEGAKYSVRLAKWVWNLILAYAYRNLIGCELNEGSGDEGSSAPTDKVRDRETGGQTGSSAGVDGHGPAGDGSTGGDALDALEDDTDNEENSAAQGLNPWGALSVERTVSLAQSVVGYSDFAEILEKQPGMRRHFSALVRKVYADEIVTLTDILSRLCGRDVSRSRDGDVDVRRQVEAYVDSFLSDEPERPVYLRRRDVPVRADVICVRDVSASMSSTSDNVREPLQKTIASEAAAQLVVALHALRAHDLRVAVVDVGKDIYVFKTFDSDLDDGLVYPDSSGLLTNFHLLFSEWKNVVEACGGWSPDNRSRFVLIISDGEWPWDLVKRVGVDTGARVLPVILSSVLRKDNPEKVRELFGVVYTDALSAFEHVVKEVTE